VTVDGVGRISNQVVAESVDFADWPWHPPVAEKAATL